MDYLLNVQSHQQFYLLSWYPVIFALSVNRKIFPLEICSLFNIDALKQDGIMDLILIGSIRLLRENRILKINLLLLKAGTLNKIIIGKI